MTDFIADAAQIAIEVESIFKGGEYLMAEKGHPKPPFYLIEVMKVDADSKGEPRLHIDLATLNGRRHRVVVGCTFNDLDAECALVEWLVS